MGVGARMREAREILGIPQREVADALGVVTPMISYYEREETPITSERVEIAAELLCLTIEEIYRGIPSERELKRRYYTRLLRQLDDDDAAAVGAPPHTSGGSRSHYDDEPDVMDDVNPPSRSRTALDGLLVPA